MIEYDTTITKEDLDDWHVGRIVTVPLASGGFLPRVDPITRKVIQGSAREFVVTDNGKIEPTNK